MRAPRPNPWIAIPAVVLGLLVGYLGWLVTDRSCRLDANTAIDAGCPVTAVIVGAASLAGTIIGIAIVLSLVYRSIAEYRDRNPRS
jgi:hypothetical protein